MQVKAVYHKTRSLSSPHPPRAPKIPIRLHYVTNSYEISTRMSTKAHKSRRDAYIHTTFSTRSCISRASRRVMCYNHTVLHNLDELCTTTTISTIQAMIMGKILMIIHRNSTRIMHEMHMISKHLHIAIMHDIIHTYRTRTHVSTEAPCTCHTGHHVL